MSVDIGIVQGSVEFVLLVASSLHAERSHVHRELTVLRFAVVHEGE